MISRNKIKYILLAAFLFGFFLAWNHKRSVRIEQALSGPHVKINKTIIGVEVADSPGEQYRGLSNRKSMDKYSGMLFVFQNKQQRVFVMREMNFSLDIVWIADNKIVKVDTNLAPEGKKPEMSYGSDYDVDYVLELNAGFVKKKKIKVGDAIEINI